MLISEMEAVLKSLDQRVGRIEQILPTLATKTDLERYATKAELRDEIRGVKVLIEDVRGEVRTVADGVQGLEGSLQRGLQNLHERIDAEAAGLSRRMDDVSRVLAEVLRRLDRR